MKTEHPTLNLRWKRADEIAITRITDPVFMPKLQQEWRCRDDDSQWYEWRDIAIEGDERSIEDDRR